MVAKPLRASVLAWGPGSVQAVEGDGLTVLFESLGYRALSAALVAAGGLLRAV